MDWYAQQLFTAEQAAARFFFERETADDLHLKKQQHALFGKCLFWSRTDHNCEYLVNISQYLSIYGNAVLGI